MKIIMSFISVLMALCLPAAVSANKSPEHSTYTQNLIVRFRDRQARPAALGQAGSGQASPGMVAPDGSRLWYVRDYDVDGAVLRMPEAMSHEQASAFARALENNPDVVSAVPDKRMYPTLVPIDTRFFEQWYLQDSEGIRGPSAWDTTQGSAAVTIAILDTGYVDHQDLDPGRKLAGYDFISDPFTANDGDGRDADPTDTGDAVDANECGPGDPLEFTPSSWHGLAVTGVIGAWTNNVTPSPLLNIAAVDHRASLLPVRVLGRCGGSFSDIADAMRWSVGISVAGVPDNPNPARVLNLSFSGVGSCSAEEQAAIDAVRAQGAAVVVSSGNENQDVAGHSPGNCNGVIVVAASNRLGGKTDYTNFGGLIDLSAPVGDGGDFVLTLSNKGQTAPEPSPAGDQLVRIQGTSFASAQVAGVVGLMLAVDPSLSPDTIERIIRNTSAPFPEGPGNDCNQSICGQGILDAAAAVAGAQDPASSAGIAANLTDGGGGGCTLGVNARPDPVWPLVMAVIIGRLMSRRRRVC